MPSIDTIGGIGVKDATKLRKARIRTTEALLRTASDRKGRRELATRTGLDEKKILGWVNRADLMRVKGIGGEYGDLLEHAGVDTVKELRRRNPKSLLGMMLEANDKKRLVRRAPTQVMVEGWVDHAKELEPIVSH
jgi:predicted RecB family nuclease